jgi:lipoyl(octanoyl) transferase
MNSVAFHFLGTVAFDEALALQTRLVFEAGERTDGRIVVLLCEHPGLVTVGRSGSRAHVRLTPTQLRAHQLEVRWVSRGGGCLLHLPGQLAVYPIVPLDQRGWLVGEYMQRLRQGLLGTLESLGIRATAPAERPRLHGRTGPVGCLGVAVRNNVTMHGAWLNVNPSMQLFGQIDAISPQTAGRGEKTTLSCLLAERHEPVTMSSVRAALVAQLANAFDCPRPLMVSGHSLLRRPSPSNGPAASIA